MQARTRGWVVGDARDAIAPTYPGKLFRKHVAFQQILSLHRQLWPQNMELLKIGILLCNIPDLQMSAYGPVMLTDSEVDTVYLFSDLYKLIF